MVVAQYNIYAINSGYFVGFKLGITPRYGDYGIGVATMYFAYYVAAFLVGMLGYRAAVYHRYVGSLRWLYTAVATSLKFTRQCRRLRKVELAAQRMKTNSLLGHNFALFVCCYALNRWRSYKIFELSRKKCTFARLYNIYIITDH